MVRASTQSIGADVNEIFFGYYLTNSWSEFHDSKVVQKELKQRSQKLKPNDMLDQEGRAEEMAEVTLSWLKKNKYGSITRKWWPKQNSSLISKVVGHKVNLDKNPLDILIKTSTNQFLGLSAKSTKSSGKPPFKNPGLGTVEKALGIKLRQFYQDAEDKLLEKYPQLPDKRSQRKKWFKQNKSFYQKNICNSEIVRNLFSCIRDEIIKELKTYNNSQLWNYFKDYWLDAGDLDPPYIVVTGRGTHGKYSASIDDRLDLQTKKLTVKPVLSDKIRIFSDGEAMFDMRVKFESTQMATSIKFSGDWKIK